MPLTSTPLLIIFYLRGVENFDFAPSGIPRRPQRAKFEPGGPLRGNHANDVGVILPAGPRASRSLDIAVLRRCPKRTVHARQAATGLRCNATVAQVAEAPPPDLARNDRMNRTLGLGVPKAQARRQSTVAAKLPAALKRCLAVRRPAFALGATATLLCLPIRQALVTRGLMFTDPFESSLQGPKELSRVRTAGGGAHSSPRSLSHQGAMAFLCLVREAANIPFMVQCSPIRPHLTRSTCFVGVTDYPLLGTKFSLRSSENLPRRSAPARRRAGNRFAQLRLGKRLERNETVKAEA